LLFKGSEDGWCCIDFHQKCDNQGPTVTVIKSSAGKVFGGFASVCWESLDNDGNWKEDEESFIFSMDLKTTYRPTNPYFALFLEKNGGPAFGGNSLSLDFCKMNSKNNGRCYTNGE
jgi:hypothetical protein